MLELAKRVVCVRKMKTIFRKKKEDFQKKKAIFRKKRGNHENYLFAAQATEENGTEGDQAAGLSIFRKKTGNFRNFSKIKLRYSGRIG